MHTRGPAKGSHTDDGLMQAVAAGDEAAFAVLVARHRNWVCRLLTAFTHSAEQAEDLAQEVFCLVHAHAGRYTAQGQFVAWLKRIAVNKGRDFRAQRRPPAPLPLAACREMPAPAAHFDPLTLLLAEVVRAELREAVLALPDAQRDAVVLRFFGAKSVAEIAAAQGCPEGTVKSRLFGGLRRIRASLASFPDSDPERNSE